ncbi:non-processive endocellulase [Duganella sp. CF402]|uniref:heme-degrading domain-containing protein n=1 Tax=unclassified Duganella TaxID=2636909 RepID=UPI0008CADA78|nr:MULTISPECIES: heme-degrading domain-containing protein [unclassified Duganella]RZT04188.1 endoglucanase [Duganella sp. BK701]SEM44847.1 non-processive endocellulase [Duganella sp. CF402]
MKFATLRPLLPLLCLAAATDSHAAIRVNQLGFEPQSEKLAVVTDGAAASFDIVAADTGKTVFSGKLGAPAVWKMSAETVRVADFSALKTPGDYRIKIAGQDLSDRFVIRADAYRGLNAAAIRAYYMNRASIALPEKYAGVYARPAGHPDDKVLVHASAASKQRPEGSVLASAKGWYDAGDYNKYIVNSGISTYTLLAAYEHFPQYFARQNLNLPETGNGLPDILNEALWNLDWMLTMQDPNDGGVYHKLTNKSFDGMEMPDQVKATPRYVVQKSTAAALDFAATMATASRIFKAYEQQRPGLSARMMAAAEAAWQWAQANPAVVFRNPSDIKTGEYGDARLDDEFAWAAAELYIGTGKDSYYRAIKADQLAAGTPGWSDVGGLAWISLAQHRAHLTPAADRQLIESRIDGLAANLAAQWRNSAYRVAMQEQDFVWGSNAVVLNQAMMLLQGYRLNGKAEYLNAAQSGLDYVLGRNATGYSFVTGIGARPAMHPHHRPSEADKVAAPVPGFLVGGPQAGQQDKKDCPVPYPAKLPATSYLDHVCSYASNEIAINWNAPLVYVSAALDQLTGASMEQKVELSTLIRQEELLQFDSFSNDTALALGMKVIELARAAGKSVAVNITQDGTMLFYHGMPGTNADNANWIRRKSNLVNRTGHSSFYTHTEVKNNGGDYDALPGLDMKDFAAHGGSFPLVVKGKGRIGTLTVSGLPGAEDHAMAVAALQAYLKVDSKL